MTHNNSKPKKKQYRSHEEIITTILTVIKEVFEKQGLCFYPEEDESSAWFGIPYQPVS